MSAQLVRLNATASNMANAGTVTGDAKSAYRAIKPVFETVTGGPGIATVKVDQVVQTDTAPVKRHDPGHPLADDNGDVWEAGVDSSVERGDMIATACQYQTDAQALQSDKSLMTDTNRHAK